MVIIIIVVHHLNIIIWFDLTSDENNHAHPHPLTYPCLTSVLPQPLYLYIYIYPSYALPFLYISSFPSLSLWSSMNKNLFLTGWLSGTVEGQWEPGWELRGGMREKEAGRQGLRQGLSPCSGSAAAFGHSSVRHFPHSPCGLLCWLLSFFLCL